MPDFMESPSQLPPADPGASPCPEDCAMCSGEYCIVHGEQPCACDAIDRHPPADPTPSAPVAPTPEQIAALIAAGSDPLPFVPTYLTASAAVAPTGGETDPYFVLDFCEGAIRDAIALEEGLDASAGAAVLAMIANAKSARAALSSPARAERGEAEIRELLTQAWAAAMTGDWWTPEQALTFAARCQAALSSPVRAERVEAEQLREALRKIDGIASLGDTIGDGAIRSLVADALTPTPPATPTEPTDA